MEHLLPLWTFVVNLPRVWLIVWLGLVAISLALILLMRTRWGQSQPLRKCAALSLIAHALLGCVATTVKLVSDSHQAPARPSVRVTIADFSDQRSDHDTGSQGDPAQPWDSPATRAAEPPAQPPARPDLLEHRIARPAERPDTSHQSALSPFALPETPRVLPGAAKLATAQLVRPEQLTAAPIEKPRAAREAAPPVQLPDAGDWTRAEVSGGDPVLQRTPQLDPAAESTREPLAFAPSPRDPVASADSPTPRGALDAERERRPAPAMPLEHLPNARGGSVSADQVPDGLVKVAEAAGQAMQSFGEQQPPAAPQTGPGDDRFVHVRHRLPTIYQQRFAHDRSEIAKQHGGSPETEAAVELALVWLAAAQHTSGRWDADQHGAGREDKVFGHDRRGAGVRADTGITALALLTFLGAGHTHLEGKYTDTVREGLNFLLTNQAADGNLAGNATLFARMYCHGMATFALGEAYAISGDDRLRPGLEAALQYTIAAQEKQTGGWRYQPGDQGDTSQFGWQIMALKSAQIGGMTVPDSTRRGAMKFLSSVSTGASAGLASYRPRQAASRAMSAEAAFCRQLLGHPLEAAAARELSNYLLQELPGSGQANFYTWYYATLILYHQQGEPWQRWNAALKNALLSTQRREGHLTGSWDTSTVWGGYGGRVYTTSLAALSLEVYYRYLPVYKEAARQQQPWR